MAGLETLDSSVNGGPVTLAAQPSTGLKQTARRERY